MSNLTDKWEKGELPDGEYYIKIKCNTYENIEKAWYYNYNNSFHTKESIWQNKSVIEVLDEVPSYGEYQQILSDQLAKNEGVEINAELEEENTKLKELLKECKHIMSIEKDFASCHFEKDKLCKLLTKINQVLGEE